MKKIDTFELDNIVLIKGSFDKTVPEFFSDFQRKIFSANIDCDLYEGYKSVLPPVWKFLSKGGYVRFYRFTIGNPIVKKENP